MRNEHRPGHEDLAKIRVRRQSKLSDIDHSVHDPGEARLGHPTCAATSG
jgi:hypothetical protein